MNCPKCEILEMRVEKVESENIHYKCKKCGEEKVINVNQLNK